MIEYSAKSLKMHLMQPDTSDAAINKMRTSDISNIDVLLNSFKKCKQGSIWKCSVQTFEANKLLFIKTLSDTLQERKFKCDKYFEFELCERGKARHIKALSVRDRVVMRALCDLIVTPAVAPKLIYDNSASSKNRGINFCRKRFLTHMHKFYTHHKNNGYILQIDFSKFFDSIDHDKLKLYFSKIISKDKMWIINIIIDSFGDNKGVGIGSQLSQLAGVYFPTKIDNYCKIVKGCKYYGRYMDDIYIIHHDIEFLKGIITDINKLSEELNLKINPKKTKITPLSKRFIFLKSYYQITNTGSVIVTPMKKAFIRESRKLKHLKERMLNGLISLQDIINSYKSWKGGIKKNYPNTTYNILKKFDFQFFKLFGVKIWQM